MKLISIRIAQFALIATLGLSVMACGGKKGDGKGGSDTAKKDAPAASSAKGGAAYMEVAKSLKVEGFETTYTDDDGGKSISWYLKGSGDVKEIRVQVWPLFNVANKSDYVFKGGLEEFKKKYDSPKYITPPAKGEDFSEVSNGGVTFYAHKVTGGTGLFGNKYELLGVTSDEWIIRVSFLFKDAASTDKAKVEKELNTLLGALTAVKAGAYDPNASAKK